MSAPWFYILGILAIFVAAWLADKAFGDGGDYDDDHDFWDIEDRNDARRDRGRRRKRRRG